MKNLLLQAVRFFGISGIGWLLDFCTYAALGLFSRNLFLNNIVSSWVGVTFTFVFSTRTVFRSAGRIPLAAKYALYLIYQLVLILAVSWLVKIIDLSLVRVFESALVKQTSHLIAKVVVTPVTMILNFFVMKILVEEL